MIRVIDFIPLSPSSARTMLMASTSISAGEPSEIATEFEQINLNEYITGGRNGFYMIRALGDSMEYEIRTGDWLITNTNRLPQPGEIIIASVNGEYLVKDYKPSNDEVMLVPKNKKYKPRIVTPKDNFQTFGVVVGIVRWFKKI